MFNFTYNNMSKNLTHNPFWNIIPIKYRNDSPFYIMTRVNKYIAFLFLLVFVMVNCSYSLSVKIPIELITILDGDTIIARINDNKFSIRLSGIDCYETSKINRAYKQAYNDNLSIDNVIKKGLAAKNYLEELYRKSKKDVYFEFQGLDNYKRVLGILYFDELNVNDELKNAGYCKVYIYKK